MQVKTILYNESTSVVLILRLFALSPDRPPRGRDTATPPRAADIYIALSNAGLVTATFARRSSPP